MSTTRLRGSARHRGTYCELVVSLRRWLLWDDGSEEIDCAILRRVSGILHDQINTGFPTTPFNSLALQDS